jgi:PAS domain-containing protein
MELDAGIAQHLAVRHPNDEQFRLLVENVTEYAIFLLDATGRVMSWNTGAERIKGYRPQDIIGRHFSIFYPPDERAAGTPERPLQRAGACARTARASGPTWRSRRCARRTASCAASPR